MHARPGRVALLAALSAALLSAGCASSSPLAGAGSIGTAATGASGSGSAGPGDTKETLAAQLHQGVGSVRSAHFELEVQAAGQGFSGAGDERLADGKLTAMKLTESLPGSAGSISIILVDGKTYVMLPTSLNKSGKPWILATTSSSNAVVRQLATSLSGTLSSASVGSVGAFVDAAKSIKTVGRDTVNGVAATRLHIVVDVKKLEASLPNGTGETLEKAGLTELPLDMWLDDEHRPVQIVEEFSVSGQQVSTRVGLSRYNRSVTITAPPASQVGR